MSDLRNRQSRWWVSTARSLQTARNEVEHAASTQSRRPARRSACKGGIDLLPGTGFEPARPEGHKHLKLARLPIPPPGQVSVAMGKRSTAAGRRDGIEHRTRIASGHTLGVSLPVAFETSSVWRYGWTYMGPKQSGMLSPSRETRYVGPSNKRLVPYKTGMNSRDCMNGLCQTEPRL